MTPITREYQGQPVNFDRDGWINATQVAKQHGKRLDHWLDNADTQRYINALSARLNTRNSGELIRTRRGRYQGGTWLHPKLAVKFARWLSVDFEIWCDEQIDSLIQHDQPTWDQVRDASKIGFAGMCDALQLTRQAYGKGCKTHHYSNEARLINGVAFGTFGAIDRDSLSPAELHLIALLEQRNIYLMGSGLSYQERKTKLAEYSRQLTSPRIGGGSQ